MPHPAPTFSRSVRAGNTLYIAGCTARGTDAQGRAVMEQLEVTLDRITRIVAAEGGNPSDIVKITTYVTSIPPMAGGTGKAGSPVRPILPE